jgi:hypothetical protein
LIKKNPINLEIYQGYLFQDRLQVAAANMGLAKVGLLY